MNDERPRTGPGDRHAVILGLSFGFHDSAAAVVVDGELVAAAEEERFTRRKHDHDLPSRSVAACLDAAGLTVNAIDEVVYYEKPLVLLNRYLAMRQRQGPAGLRSFVADVPDLLGRTVGVGYRVAAVMRELGWRGTTPLRFVEHHRSHAAAAFFPSPFDNAAILTVDGLGEWATATIAHGTGNRIMLLEEQRYPDSLGLLYSFVTAWCGFAPNDGEYKLMGLAPYGAPRYAEALAELAPISPGGSVRVDAKRLRWYSPAAFGRPELHRVFGGPPRERDAPITERDADLAASMQAHVETALLAMAARAHEITGERNLVMGGGVALNCVANGRIHREGRFDQMWVQPAAGDAGSAAGAALALWHEEHRGVRPPRRGGDGMSGAYLGSAIARADVLTELEAQGIEYEVVVERDDLVRRVAASIADGAVVGWVQGRMEFGPRALGNRSLLADPRDPTMRTRLNVSVKGRESFRPFAPAVLADRADEWFELGTESPYMLHVAPVRADRRCAVDVEPVGIVERSRVPRSQIPACTHVDGSARVQTVTASSNPDFHRLLTAFDAVTGCPVLVNTSFNLAGEPIVESVADVIRTARIGGVDLLVIDDVLVTGAALGALGERLASRETV